jgi:DNA (cytosine-5)-methyltransferase 1
MKHLGDICKINGAEIEPVDCITGGSPCQDLSIAGKRAGLAGERSGLFMEQVRIVKEMRERDRRNGRADNMVRPRFLVWENVVGAFSSNKGKDFAAVLEKIARIAEPGFSLSGLPEKWKWTKAGAIDGDGWSIAWRTHDAQYWGVPQRRRRISVVADFGGQSAGEILFERKSVSRHPAESREAGEGFAEAAEAGASYAVRIRGGCDGGGKGALVQTEKSGTLGTGNNQTIFCLQGNGIDRADTAGCNGKGWREDACYTLNTIDRPAVVAPAVALDMTHACDVIRECGEQVPALQARMGTGGNQVPLTYQMNGFGDYRAAEVASSCKQRDFKDSTDLVCSSVDFRNFREGGEVNGTLQAKESGGQSLNLNNTVRQHMVARRLTPMECERLQGFPDGWTDIGDWVKTDKRGREIKVKGSADSPRYKALGNSIALPFWDWMLRRMSWYLPEGATLGSLFDGIAGFPLIWERIHGKGMARWASEIEQFPMAVTKLRFPEEA